jgi:hypothetical protein
VGLRSAASTFKSVVRPGICRSKIRKIVNAALANPDGDFGALYSADMIQRLWLV